PARDIGDVVNARLFELARRDHQTRKNLAVAALFLVEHDLDRILLAAFAVGGDLVFAAHHQTHGAGHVGGAHAQFGGSGAVERDAQFGAGEKEGRFGTDDAGKRADLIAGLARQFAQLVEFGPEQLHLNREALRFAAAQGRRVTNLLARLRNLLEDFAGGGARFLSSDFASVQWRQIGYEMDVIEPVGGLRQQVIEFGQLLQLRLNLVHEFGQALQRQALGQVDVNGEFALIVVGNEIAPDHAT